MSNVDDGEFGNDVVDNSDAGERKRTFFQNFRFIVAGGVFHGDEDALGAGDEIHGAAHAFQHFAGDGPVGEGSLFIDLQRAENGEVDVAATNHGERIGGRKVGAAGEFGDGFLSGVDEIGVDLGFERIGADAEHAVFGLQNDVHTFRDVIGDERGHANAEIDVVAVAQFEGDSSCDAFAFLVFGQQQEKFTVDSLQLTAKNNSRRTGRNASH